VSGLGWRGTAVVLAVFASGVLVGAVGSRHLAWRRMDHGLEGREGQGVERMLLRAIDRHVGLDDAQRDRVEEILRDAHRQRRSLLAPVEPALDALRRKNEARIREVLRGDQRPAFDAFAERMAARHRRGLPPPGPPPFDLPPGEPPPGEPPP
jgi:hypothetical protein